MMPGGGGGGGGGLLQYAPRKIAKQPLGQQRGRCRNGSATHPSPRMPLLHRAGSNEPCPREGRRTNTLQHRCAVRGARAMAVCSMVDHAGPDPTRSPCDTAARPSDRECPAIPHGEPLRPHGISVHPADGSNCARAHQQAESSSGLPVLVILVSAKTSAVNPHSQRRIGLLSYSAEIGAGEGVRGKRGTTGTQSSVLMQYSGYAAMFRHWRIVADHVAWHVFLMLAQLARLSGTTMHASDRVLWGKAISPGLQYQH